MPFHAIIEMSVKTTGIDIVHVHTNTSAGNMKCLKKKMI